MAKTKSTRIAKTSARRNRSKKEPTYTSIEGRAYERDPRGNLVIEGHRLNADQEAIFREKVSERLRIARSSGSSIRDPFEYAHHAGLADLLWRYRPRTNAKDSLLQLSNELSSVALAIGSMREYAFYSGGAVHREGAATVSRLVKEADRRVAKLRHFAESLELESSTKLHHWTARQEKLEAMEAPHV